MNDRRSDSDLEARLQRAFHATVLPTAPEPLREGLERIPDAPIAASGNPHRRGGSSGGRAIVGILGIAAVLALAGALALSGGAQPPGPSPSPASPAASGVAGLTLTYRVEWSSDVPATSEAQAAELSALRHRLDATGVVDGVVRFDGTDRLVVSVPGVGTDSAPFRALIGPRGEVAFVPLGDTQVQEGDLIDAARFPALFGSDGIVGAAIGSDQSGLRVVTITLSSTAATLFGDYTAAHIGSYVAITLDGSVISAPVIRSAIPGGTVEITRGSTPGGWPLEDASRFVTILQAGPLPAPLTEIEPPGPTGSAAGSTPSPALLPSSPVVSPSQEVLDSAIVHCEPPLEVQGPQLGCDEAVQAALALLPPTHPAIRGVTFFHACNDVVLRSADCFVQAFGLVTFTFDGEAAPVRVGMSLGSPPQILASPVASSEPAFALVRTPIDLGCDAVPPPYRSFTFRVDPAATETVWAVADTGARLRVLWGATDRGRVGPPAAVVDLFGLALASDGTSIEIPDAAWPSLAGRFICPGPDAVYVTDLPAQ